VRGVYDALFARAMSLGHVMSDDPDLAVLGDGHVLPIVRDGSQIRVALPALCRAVRLRSRRFVPAQMFAGSDDHRVLGVALAADDLDFADGWHPAEPDLRWTNGEATINVTGVRELRFTLAATGRYWVAPAAQAPSRPAPRCYPARRA
jgi:hypothetical protein